MDFSKLSIADSSPPPSESDQSINVGAPSLQSPQLARPILRAHEAKKANQNRCFPPLQRDKLTKLAKWRIDPCSIEFDQEGAREFEGGHAIVSRAFLTPASSAAAGTTSTKVTNVDGGGKSDGEKAMRKAVAVKKLKIEGKEDRERVLGLALREAALLVGLSSQYTVNLEGFVEDLSSNRIWLIFLWHEHGNLKDFVASQDWEIPERICLIGDVASGVEYLHTQSPPIYHGDLRSINVLVTAEYRAVITDFGSARHLTRKDADVPPTTRTEKNAQPAPEFQATFCATNNTMTFTGNQYTLRWDAPELLKDEELTLASDIWALGWIFYEVMTNSIPFEDVKRDSVIIIHVVHGKLPCVTDHVRVSLILRLSSLMVACWSVDPTKRPTAAGCRKLLDWMPMAIPVPEQPSDSISGRLYPRVKAISEALAIYQEASNDAGKADALSGLGLAHACQAEYSKAMASYSEALQICTDIDYKPGRAQALLGLAEVHKRQGEYSKAVPLYSKAIQAAIDIDDELKRADALKAFAEVLLIQKDYDEAVNSFSEVVEIYTRRGSIFGRSNALAGLAEAKRLQAKYSEAAALFSESLTLSTDIGHRFGIAFASRGLADIHRKQGRLHDALRLYEEACEIYEEIGRKHKAARFATRAADLRRRLEGLETE